MSGTFKICLPYILLHADWPIGHYIIVQRGVHDAVRNKNGAVSVVLPDGTFLGINPGEYEEVISKCQP